MKDLQNETLTYDPIHGYIPFISRVPGESEVAERDVLDQPWVQRLRQIHQLQTAWWVYPTAEHTRFQHVVGAMHLASRATATLYDSLLSATAGNVPSRGYVECLMRMAALLHDVGHGPFGHFLDEHFLSQFGLTHETLGATVIRDELGPLLRGVRRCPGGQLEAGEQLDPEQIAFLITRPRSDEEDIFPRWLTMLRSLFCGIYTVDNLDFVLRDAFMSGFSKEAYDLDRILHYSFFSEAGLTIHSRGVDALLRFMHARAGLFRAIYFHRTVRAIDLTLAELFRDSREFLFDGNPLENLPAYQQFTEWTLLVDVSRWPDSDNAAQRALGQRWCALLGRRLEWQTLYERNLVFGAGQAETASLFSDAELLTQRLKRELPPELGDVPLCVDLPRHIYRPHAKGPAARQNFLYQPAKQQVRPLTDDQLFRQLPVSHRFCRVYGPKDVAEDAQEAIARTLDSLLGGAAEDDLTNV